MKASFIGVILVFALSICGIAFLSKPDETTRIAMLLDNHELERARELLWKEYQRDPDNPDIAKKLVETLQALKELPEAKMIAQAALSRSPGDVYWKRSLASILLAEKDPHAAARILPPEERDKDLWGAFAEGYHDISENALAEEALFAACAQDSDKADVWRRLAAWRSERGDSQGEKEALEKALASAPDDQELIARLFRNRAKAHDLKATVSAAAKLPHPLDREFLEALYALHTENHNYKAAQEILEQLTARKDTTTADTLALVSIHYLQKNFARAKELLDRLGAQPGERSQEVKDAIMSQSQAVRMALLLESAKNGNEQPLLKEIAALRAQASSPDPAVLRALLYGCLQLSDYYKTHPEIEGKTAASGVQKHGLSRAQFWLEQAKSIFDLNKGALPLEDDANSHLAADLAERRSDWQGMLEAWNSIAGRDATSLDALLGAARASRNLGDYGTSWQNLARAEKLVKDDAGLLALALQAQDVARSLPGDDRQREQKLRHADDLARKSLARNWNGDLAHNLFFRALETKNLNEADNLLQALENNGLAVPEQYLALAEAQISRGGQPARNAAGATAERARSNAKKALAANAPDTLPRLLYIFMALKDRQQVAELLKRIEQGRLPQTPALLHQLAEACALLGDHKRQFALLEKRARLTGQLGDWKELIELRYWNKDQEGALQLLDAAESRFPANAELASLRLLALADMGRYKQALKSFQAVQGLDPEIGKKLSAESLAALALAYDRNGYPDRARHFYNLSLGREPANNRAALGLADLARREGKEAEAGHLLQAAIGRDPSNVWARAELADLKPEQGKKQYKSILKSKQAEGTGEKAARALALWKTGRLDQALLAYSGLIKTADRTSAIMCDYAQALMEADKPDTAKRVLRQAMAEFPDSLPPLRLLAAIFIREKQYAPAETILRKALALAPGNRDVARDLAFVQQAQKKFWSAQKSYVAGGRR